MRLSPEGTAELQIFPNWRNSRLCGVDFIGQENTATDDCEVRFVAERVLCGRKSGYAPVEMTVLFEHRTLRFHERSVEPQIPRLRSG